jgi:hypothetical protein
VNLARVGLAALLVVGLVGAVRAEDKKETPRTETVDFRKLKEIMPAELNGLKRSECNGERSKFGEVSISQVNATYKKGDDEKAPKVDVQVIDYNNPEMAKGISAAWSTVEIDKESDDGFEKTVKVKGNPGMISWQKEDSRGTINLLVGGRYVVNMTTENVASGDVIKMAEALPLDKLAALK